MANYEAICKRIAELSDKDRLDMQNLYLSHYAGCSKAQVASDLQDKSEAILVFLDHVLVGFTTLKVYERQWVGHDIRIIFSGDTIVERAHWGQQALAFTWIMRMGQLQKEKPDLPMYWFLIVKGHRTYKYLPVFGKSFYPHWAIDRTDLKPLADTLAQEKFGADYNLVTGVVEFPESKGHLMPDIALPTEEEKSKESVQFFLAKNPNYINGHELVCLCEITEQNMKPLTKRIFAKGLA